MQTEKPDRSFLKACKSGSFGKGFLALKSRGQRPRDNKSKQGQETSQSGLVSQVRSRAPSALVLRFCASRISKYCKQAQDAVNSSTCVPLGTQDTVNSSIFVHLGTRNTVQEPKNPGNQKPWNWKSEILKNSQGFDNSDSLVHELHEKW